MAYDKDNLISKLNDLLTLNYDAEKGFIEAGNHVNQKDLVQWFNANATTRRNFQHELKAHIIALGGEPSEGTSFTGELHRIWMDWKTYLPGSKTTDMFDECLRGENKALEDYQEIMNEVNTPVATSAMLNKQVGEINNNIKSLKTLEKMFVPAGA
mgnify:CR=1 FL=1